MLGRLVGLETEYAIRFAPAAGKRAPGNRAIYRALAEAIGREVSVLPGERRGGEEGRFFTESGASFCYEHLPIEPEGGLIEAGTPECLGPSQLICHQKALDRLLEKAIPVAQQILTERGHPGELGLLKNCRDAEGHIYGAQENYEAEVAKGLALFAYRASLVIVLPLVAIHCVIAWALAIVMMMLLLCVGLPLLGLAAWLVPRWRPSIATLFDQDDSRFERTTARMLWGFDRVLSSVTTAIAGLPFRLFAFRRQRRALLGFLVSRCILTGAGSLAADGRFGLSEKGPAIRRIMRVTAAPGDRPLFDTGNLLKELFGILQLRFSSYTRLFERCQRLQLGLSDSNVAQIAEYLKVGTTSLVLHMAEAGLLEDAPRPRRPIAALHAFAADPGLQARAPIVRRAPMSALEIQRYYLDKAREFLRSTPTPSLEAQELISLWGDVVAELERAPSRLFGVLDWPTKLALVERCGENARAAVRKKVDLRYHELGVGYYAALESNGLARRIVGDQEIEEATRTPPEQTPARLRGELIRQVARSGGEGSAGWDRVRLGKRFRGKVIPLRRP
ncbi:MAG TPA: proteasome accessory factor PafA2 family protein [Polyangiaceae bacterium]|jgi:Pup amidohydrolase|nr:proteasome accessory factor PafA2 family protein [Polyangiaceae bacterium]